MVLDLYTQRVPEAINYWQECDTGAANLVWGFHGEEIPPQVLCLSVAKPERLWLITASWKSSTLELQAAPPLREARIYSFSLRLQRINTPRFLTQNQNVLVSPVSFSRTHHLFQHLNRAAVSVAFPQGVNSIPEVLSTWPRSSQNQQPMLGMAKSLRNFWTNSSYLIP